MLGLGFNLWTESLKSIRVLDFRVYGLGFGVWVIGFRGQSLGFRD